MPDWYVYGGGVQTGPIGHDEAIAFLRTKDPDAVHVWREGFDRWRRLRNVPELAAAVHPIPAATGAPPAATRPRRRQTARKHAAGKQPANSPRKASWALAGAAAGLAICAADLLLEWRGAKFAAWDSIAGLGHNFDHLCGTLVLTGFLGFIAGAIRDAADDGAPRKSARRRPVRADKIVPLTNIVVRHWRGELPLWVSCWVFGVAGSIVISFLPAVAVAMLKAERSYNPASIFSASAAVWLAVFAVAVWQSVGIWRSATRYAAATPASRKDKTGAAELVPLWSMLARFVVIAGLASLLGTFGTEWLPQLRELYKIAFHDDPDIPPYSIQLSRDGTEIEVTGGFKYGLTDDFAALTKDALRLRVVRLDSAGGRLGEAERLFTLIRERGLSTYVSSKCFSACTLAFAGGRERVLKRGAALGFHRAEFPGVSEDEFDSLQHRVFSAAGFDGRFIERALSTPHKDLWTPPPDVLLAAGVITGVSDGTRTSRLPQAENTIATQHASASR
jgi:hypothetical protein